MLRARKKELRPMPKVEARRQVRRPRESTSGAKRVVVMVPRRETERLRRAELEARRSERTDTPYMTMLLMPTYEGVNIVWHICDSDCLNGIEFNDM